MIVANKDYGGLYDRINDKITKVLRLYGNNDVVRYERFDYQNGGNYRKATKKDIRKGRKYYYDENGVKVLWGYNR